MNQNTANYGQNPEMKRVPVEAVPPQDDTTPNPNMGNVFNKQLMEEAVKRRDTLVSQAAINLALAFAAHSCGETKFTFRQEDLIKFASKHRVDKIDNPDGSYTVSIVEKCGV